MPCVLYLIEILHQTTTFVRVEFDELMLYLIEILHQTTTFHLVAVSGSVLYLIEILHQTTTGNLDDDYPYCCILSKFYIKPQLPVGSLFFRLVVSYRNSTSNHNNRHIRRGRHRVVSYRNSTSNHNDVLYNTIRSALYLIEILHQTTTCLALLLASRRCILSKFYIKPQQCAL